MVHKAVPARRKAQKAVHLALHLMALVAGVLGIYAVFKLRHEAGYPKLLTLHSWLAISTISLSGLQVTDRIGP